MHTTDEVISDTALRFSLSFTVASEFEVGLILKGIMSPDLISEESGQKV
jgi:hypothetical protein